MRDREELEVDIVKLVRGIWRRMPLILLAAVLAAAAVIVYFRSPVSVSYTARSRFLVEPNYSLSEKQGEDKNGSFSEEKRLAENANSVETYCYVATARSTLEKVASKGDLPYTADELASKVSAFRENDKVLVFTVEVHDPDRYEAERIAHAFAQALPEELSSMTPGAPLRVLDDAVVSQQTSGGIPLKKAVWAAIAVVFLLACFFVLKNLVEVATGDITVSTYDLLNKYSDTRILSAFPKSIHDAEAIRRLRSNIRIAFPEGPECRVLGLTAAHEDAGKDELALALAESLAELGDRVLLIDADFRSNRLRNIAHAEKGSGLCELLQKNAPASELLQRCGNEHAEFSFLAAGEGEYLPANLLDDRILIPAIDKWKSDYDYILLDLSEIGTTIDAAVIGGKIDGTILFLREELCKRRQLDAAISQLSFAKAKILGFVTAARSKR
ncbi:MAG: AAA family ATPase [Clostridia bacterium]|nr:AAA family ATPase [Clostridia bacterium]